MALREIQTDDIPTIINLLLNLRDESPTYVEVFPDVEFVSANLEAMHRQSQFVGVIDDAGRGCMFGMVTPQWYNPQVNAYEQLLYVLPELRGTGIAIRLIRAFEVMCKQDGAEYLHVGTSTGIKEGHTQALYERLGYQQYGGGLRKRLT